MDVLRDSDELTEILQEVSAILQSEEDLQATLKRIVRIADQLIHSCDGTGITLVRDGRAETAAATNPELSEVDSRQYELGDGPCLQALRDQRVFRIDEMASEERWPDFCSHAAAHGLHGHIAFPLTVRDEAVGVLNLYSTEPRGFADEDQELGLLLAGQAAVALANSRLYQDAVKLTQQLNEALESRGIIERAKGVLMEREKCSEDEAFEMLRTASQHLNRKVRDIAFDVVSDLPDKGRGDGAVS
jgi:GAF domain-containing protein